MHYSIKLYYRFTVEKLSLCVILFGTYNQACNETTNAIFKTDKLYCLHSSYVCSLYEKFIWSSYNWQTNLYENFER